MIKLHVFDPGAFRISPARLSVNCLKFEHVPFLSLQQQTPLGYGTVLNFCSLGFHFTAQDHLIFLQFCKTCHIPCGLSFLPVYIHNPDFRRSMHTYDREIYNTPADGLESMHSPPPPRSVLKIALRW